MKFLFFFRFVYEMLPLDFGGMKMFVQRFVLCAFWVWEAKKIKVVPLFFSLILKVRAFSLWIEIAIKKIQSGLFVCYLIFILKDQMGNIDFYNDA